MVDSNRIKVTQWPLEILKWTGTCSSSPLWGWCQGYLGEVLCNFIGIMWYLKINMNVKMLSIKNSYLLKIFILFERQTNMEKLLSAGLLPKFLKQLRTKSGVGNWNQVSCGKKGVNYFLYATATSGTQEFSWMSTEMQSQIPSLSYRDSLTTLSPSQPPRRRTVQQ